MMHGGSDRPPSGTKPQPHCGISGIPRAAGNIRQPLLLLLTEAHINVNVKAFINKHTVDVQLAHKHTVNLRAGRPKYKP